MTILASTLLAASAIAILYALHHLRTQPNQKKIATLIFWRSATRPQQTRTLRSRRFAHRKTFALLSAIVLLVALALSAVRWGNIGSHEQQPVIVIDSGEAMAAEIKPGKTLMQSAVADANADLEGLGGSGTLIIAGPQPLVAAQDEPAAVLRWKLKSLLPEQGASASLLALDLAATVQGEHQGKIDWYTAQSSLPDGLPLGFAARIQLHTITAPPSVAIVNLNFSGDGSDQLRGALHVGLAGNSTGPMTAMLHATGAEQSLQIAAGQSDVTFTGLPADGASVTVQLANAPGPASAHIASLRLPDNRPITFQFTGEIPRSLRQVLLAIGSESPAGRIAVCTNAKEAGASPAIVVMNGDPQTSSRVPLAVVDDNSLTQGLSLDGATAAAGPSVPRDVTPLITAGPIIAAGIGHRGENQTLYLSSCLLNAESDFPKTAAFPVLLSRICAGLAGRSVAPAVVSSLRAAEDPLWLAGGIAVMPDAPVYHATPLSISHPQSRREFAWTSLLLIAALTLLVCESLLFTFRKTV